MATKTVKRTLEEILLEKGVLPKEKIDLALQESRKTGETLRQILIRQGLIPESQLMPYVAQSVGLPYLDISNYEINPEVIKLVPRDVIVKYKILPIFKVEKNVTLAVVDPFNYLALDTVKKYLSSYLIKTVVTSEQNIGSLLKEFSGTSESIKELVKGVDLAVFKTKTEVEKTKAKEKEASPEDAPIIKIVNLVVTDAVERGASDIHIEPEERLLKIRFRIDGVLYEQHSFPKDLHEAIVSRIKVLSELDIAQKRIPQDGRFGSLANEKEYDFRVSTFPGEHGEDIVIRILDKSGVILGLENLGLSKENLKSFDDLIQYPNGIILVTGPTGSGKSTTLYSALSKLNKPDTKIVTIEDPIEYQLTGICQSQVNPKAGFTFASGLRSILRHDPDIIMVGEIRDLETAEIAIQAALTGHLVLSTLHTNDASGAPTRLIDMGVEPFLISSSVIGIMAQRLVRTICSKCKESYIPSTQLLEQLNFPVRDNKDIKFFKGKGCSRCNHTGYSGRNMIAEIIVITDAIREEIMKRSTSEDIKKVAQKEGMKTLREDGYEKIKEGITTVEEILRVV